MNSCSAESAPSAPVEPEEVRERVRRDLLAYVIGRQPAAAEPIHFDTPLLERGIIDSLSMVTFIMYLEQNYHLDFMRVEVNRDDFASIDALSRFVLANLKACAPVARVE